MSTLLKENFDNPVCNETTKVKEDLEQTLCSRLKTLASLGEM